MALRTASPGTVLIISSLLALRLQDWIKYPSIFQLPQLMPIHNSHERLFYFTSFITSVLLVLFVLVSLQISFVSSFYTFSFNTVSLLCYKGCHQTVLTVNCKLPVVSFRKPTILFYLWEQRTKYKTCNTTVYSVVTFGGVTGAHWWHYFTLMEHMVNKSRMTVKVNRLWIFVSQCLKRNNFLLFKGV